MMALAACSSNSDSGSDSTEGNMDEIVLTESPVDVSVIDVAQLTPEELMVEQYTAAVLETTINFGFNSLSISPEYSAILDAHAQFLIDNPNVSITIEGYTDDRGTPEYNIALGERRALGVARYLENMGVAANQITVVSYGEEKPVNPAHNEAAWAENRRAELVY